MSDVQVKPLEWRDLTYGMQPHWTAHHSFGAFDVRHEPDQAWPWVVRPFITGQSNYKTLGEAKAAAETEYAARIRSALVPAPAVPDDVAKTVAELRKAYALVAEFPESKPDGFMNLLALRNLTPDAADTIEALAASVDRANAANEALCADVEAQAAELARYREALGPFAAVAEHDIGDDETDGEAFRPMQFVNRAPKLTVGDLRRARAALTQPTGDRT